MSPGEFGDSKYEYPNKNPGHRMQEARAVFQKYHREFMVAINGCKYRQKSHQQ